MYVSASLPNITTTQGESVFATSFVTAQWQWVLLNGVAVTTGAALIGNLVVNVTLAKWFVVQRGRMVGWASMGVSSAGVVLTPAATMLVDAVGWRTAWQAIAIASVVVMFPLTFLMRRAPEDHGLHPDGRTDAQRAEAVDKVVNAGREQAKKEGTELTEAQRTNLEKLAGEKIDEEAKKAGEAKP